MKIRTRLNILLLCAALVPLCLATTAFFFTARTHVGREIERRLDLHANFVRAWVISTVEDYSARLRTVAEVSQFGEAIAELDESRKPEAREHLSKILRFAQLSIPSSSTLDVYDSRGQHLGSSRQGASSPERFPYVEELRRPGRDSFTTFALQANRAEEVYFHFATRVEFTDGRSAFLLLRSDASVLRELAKRAMDAETAAEEELILAVRRSRDGTPAAMAFRPDASEPVVWHVDAKHDPAVQRVFAANESSAFGVERRNGRDVFTVTRTIPQIDGGLILQVDRSAIVDPLRSVSLLIFGVCGLLMLAAVIFVRKVSEKLDTPLVRLINVVRRLESGDLSARVGPQRIAELAELEHAFNSMTDELKSSKSALEGEIARVKAVELQNLWYGSILRNSHEGVIGTDLNADIILWNEAAEKIFGYSAAEAIGKPIDIIVPNGQLVEEQTAMERLRAGETMEAVETTRRRRDGELIEVSLSISPIVGPGGEFRGAAKIVRDISKRKQTESFIRNSLQEKELLLKEIHHRVKNNLQVISSLLRLQGEYLPDERSRGLFKQCDDRVRSMALIHERLYRSEGFSDIDLCEYVKELAGSLVRTYAMRASKITLELDLQPVRLGIDKAIPCGLLLNEFISNALKHAFIPSRPGVLRLELHEDDAIITLVVSDNGKGLSDDWDMNRTVTLGFQIVRTLVEQLGGTLDVSREGGTTLTLTFAITDSEPQMKDDRSQHLGM